MRILLLNYEFPPVGGGASSATFNMGRELVRRGHHVDVLTCRADDQPEFERVEEMYVYRVASSRKSIHEAGMFAPFSYVFYAHGVLKRLLQENRYDFGHFYFAIPTGLLAFRWRSMTDTPYLVSLRGSDVPGYDPNASAINFLHKLLMPFTRSILRHGQAVVANSECLRLLAKQSFADEKIITITNGVCYQDFVPDSNQRRDQQHITALCVARLIPRKGIAVLLEAFARCKSSNLRLVIAGTGPLQQTLKEHAKLLEIDNRVDFVGSIHSSKIVRYYQQADFLVHPALVESFSMTLLEAMSSGLPIIASDVGGIPELIENQTNGFLTAPGDIDAMADAIDTMSGSRALREQFSAANRVKILNHFTWEHITSAYEQQYDSAVTPMPQNEPG